MLSAALLVGVMVGVGVESRLLGMINERKEFQYTYAMPMPKDLVYMHCKRYYP